MICFTTICYYMIYSYIIQAPPEGPGPSRECASKLTSDLGWYIHMSRCLYLSLSLSLYIYIYIYTYVYLYISIYSISISIVSVFVLLLLSVVFVSVLTSGGSGAHQTWAPDSGGEKNNIYIYIYICLSAKTGENMLKTIKHAKGETREHRWKPANTSWGGGSVHRVYVRIHVCIMFMFIVYATSVIWFVFIVDTLINTAA